MTFYVYVLYNKANDKIYIGQTNNLERRLDEHNNQKLKLGGKYTSKYSGEWYLFYNENLTTKKEALIREKKLKTSQGRLFLKKILREKEGQAPG